MGIPVLDKLLGNIYYKVASWSVRIAALASRIEKLNKHIPALIRLRDATRHMNELLTAQCEEEDDVTDF